MIGTIQPHLALFATILPYGELLIALSLILGFGTRIGAFAAACLAALYWSMSGQFATVGYATDNAAAFLLSLTCLVLPVGMSLDIDGERSRKQRPAAVDLVVETPKHACAQNDAARDTSTIRNPLV
ncbi:MAG: hypothetical protein M3R51_03105 [Candidatus Eremiobacteraeota bacterium]|nr:hypothetical protein [Candidatus Eremiobacteraeota bacterium]